MKKVYLGSDSDVLEQILETAEKSKIPVAIKDDRIHYRKSPKLYAITALLLIPDEVNIKDLMK